VAAVLLESTAPDWIVWVIAGVRRGRKVMHRGMRASWPLWGFFAQIRYAALMGCACD
jgi:hypothetical protein